LEEKEENFGEKRKKYEMRNFLASKSLPELKI
jgi:hypothetical protein